MTLESVTLVPTRHITTKDGVRRVMGEKAECPECGMRCHRKGEKYFGHVNRIVTRWYCGGREGCGAYHNRIPTTGAIIEPPADWREQRSAETERRRAEKRASRPKKERKPREPKQGVPLEQRLAAQFGIDPAALGWQGRKENGTGGRVIVYEMNPDTIAKLAPDAQEAVRQIQSNILLSNAILGKFKETARA